MALKGLSCPICRKASGIDSGGDFQKLGETFQCGSCGADLEMSYDETWDGEEEHGWFYLVGPNGEGETA
ncbi:hypothetical protein IVA96_06935 [Bradyrhizobium sp. 159]|uniref:hypothetical protein n=1 Tax=Bradyrhizobium sp. 159 TaxID=2782632 RepID=UPI001FFBF3FE|nr:hypothetical protein [Bradyrhizobium sp. 159]MCK1616397.1 hypothetical protein [Bradyrhizobium sp. 159]